MKCMGKSYHKVIILSHRHLQFILCKHDYVKQYSYVNNCGAHHNCSPGFIKELHFSLLSTITFDLLNMKFVR